MAVDCLRSLQVLVDVHCFVAHLQTHAGTSGLPDFSSGQTDTPPSASVCAILGMARVFPCMYKHSSTRACTALKTHVHIYVYNQAGCVCGGVYVVVVVRVSYVEFDEVLGHFIPSVLNRPSEEKKNLENLFIIRYPLVQIRPSSSSPVTPPSVSPAASLFTPPPLALVLPHPPRSAASPPLALLLHLLLASRRGAEIYWSKNPRSSNSSRWRAQTD